MGLRVRHTVALALLAALLLGVIGCGGNGESSPTGSGSGATSTATVLATEATVPVYFSDSQGRLVERRRPVPAGVSPLDAAMSALADGPGEPGLSPALPEGARPLSSRIEGDVAVVDFSREFEEGYPGGGSAAELAIVAPIVRTATEASGARAVRILVEGRPPAPLGSQIDFSQPLLPSDFPGS